MPDEDADMLSKVEPPAPCMSNLVLGLAVPIPTLPLVSTCSLAEPFVCISKGVAFDEPTKPTFPEVRPNLALWVELLSINICLLFPPVAP